MKALALRDGWAHCHFEGANPTAQWRHQVSFVVSAQRGATCRKHQEPGGALPGARVAYLLSPAGETPSLVASASASNRRSQPKASGFTTMSRSLVSSAALAALNFIAWGCG